VLRVDAACLQVAEPLALDLVPVIRVLVARDEHLGPSSVAEGTLHREPQLVAVQQLKHASDLDLAVELVDQDGLLAVVAVPPFW